MEHAEIVKQHIGEILSKMAANPMLKVPVAFLATGASWLFGAENLTNLALVTVLVAFDFITAIGAAYKTGVAIESRKALKTVTKMVVYGLLVSASYLTEQVVPGTTFLDNAATSFLALTELISILENVGKMGYAIPNKLLNRIHEIRD